MRDPLHRIQVRHKLALTFVVVCLLAFGVGGYLVSTSAGTALEGEIVRRLEFQCRSYADALDEQMRLMTRRAEDFASDGYIRERFEALAAARDPARRELLARELEDHLRRNKLPLVPAFLDLAAVAPDGAVLVTVRDVPSPHLGSVAAAAAAHADGPWHSGVLLPTEVDPLPIQALAVPVRSLDLGREVGRLVAFVNPGAWIAGAMRDVRDGSGTPAESEGAKLALSLTDASGRRLVVPSALLGARAPEADAELVRTGFGLRVEDAAKGGARPPEVRFVTGGGIFSANPYPVETLGWSAHVELHAADALSAVSGLRSRFLGVGIVLAVATGVLLLFPMQFVARPLLQLREAARRIREGDFSARVEARSEDEIGDLARAFNHMAEGVEERTRWLEDAAVELAAERDRLNAVIASMRDGLVVLGPDGRPMLSNAAARPLLELLGAEDARTAAHYACDVAAEARSCASCLLDASRGARSCLLDHAGRTYEIHATRLPPGPDGRAGRVLVGRDVTERLHHDESQIHQERLAVLGEVAAVVAHELNNPLAAIRMFAQMLEAGLPASSPFHEHLEVIRRNTDTCKGTIRGLLDYATGASPELGPLRVHAVLDDALRFVRPLAERSGVSLGRALEAKDDLVAGDDIQLRQVFVNLILNAVQAMDVVPGPPVREVRVETRNEGEHLVVDVRDTGPGVPAVAQPRIFDAFFTTKRRGAGTGLGLPTARRIAELHGGRLELVASRPGETVFRVRLRTARPRAAAGAAAAEASA